MASVKCSVCGIEREDDGKLSCCPLCGGEFSPVEEPVADEVKNVEEEIEEIFDPELLRAQLYEISLPAVNDEKMTDTVIANLKKFLEKKAQEYPLGTFDALWSIFPLYERRIERDREQRQKARSKQVSNALAEYKTAMNKPTPSLGFSVITNNTIDAAAYVGLAAFEEKKHRIKQETAALKKFNEEIRALGGSTGNEDYYTLRKAIDRLVDHFTVLHNAYTFVEANKDFYQNPSQYDVGLSMEGINIYQVLAEAVSNPYSSGGFIGEYSSSAMGGNWLLRMLHGAGYIRYWRGYPAYGESRDYYVTTGKYERAILQNQHWTAHPEEKAAYDKENATQYAKAEEHLKTGKFYDAAVTFAKLDGYRDAMQRSINIWMETILPLWLPLKKNVNTSFNAGYAVTSKGTVLFSKNNQESLSSLRSYKIKQLVSVYIGFNESFVALDYNGHLISKLTPHAAEKLHASKWKTENVISIYACCSDYLVFLYKDGTAAFWGELNKKEISLSRWNNISSIFCFNKAILGLKTDGTIIAMGEATAFENTYCGWKNVLDIQYESGTIIALTSDGKVYAVGNRPDLYNYCCISGWGDVINVKMRYNTIVALTSSGRVFAEGPDPEKYNLISKWGDIVSVDISEKGVPLGITKIGSLRYGSTWENRIHSEKATLGELLGLRGIVSLLGTQGDIGYALKADGTVHVCSNVHHQDEYSEWKNIVAPIDYTHAIQADGTIALVKTALEEEKIIIQNWRLFEHIDTIREERQKTADEYRGQAVVNQKSDIADNRDANCQKEKSGGCYIATAVYGSYDCPQVWTLRRFRDLTLKRTWYGRLFIRIYYAVSPTLVKCFGDANWFKNFWKPMLDRMVNALNANGVNDKPYEDKVG